MRGQTLIVLAFVALAVAPSNASAAQHARPCVVPNVKGATLKTARKRLLAARCAVGRVTGPRNAFVKGQSPKPHQRRKRGAKVSLSLARKPKAVSSPPTSVSTPAPVATPIPSAPAGPPEPVGIPGSWQLVLDSEFNGTTLPPDWQSGWFGSGVTGPASSSELDCYSPNNVSFPGDGTMHLTVNAQTSTCGGNTEPYTAALINTNPDDGRSGPGFQYTYGVLEAMVYLPGDNGKVANWPGVWADGQNWPTTGEDDLMEGLQGCTYWSFHGPLGLTNDCVSNIGPGWHTFASDWEPGSVTYYYDGVEVGSVTTDITSSPMYIVLDNVVHSDAPNVTTADSMQVKYVRVWQH